MSAPRVLSVDLGRLGGERVAPARCEDPLLEWVGSWGGNALGLATLLERARRDAAAPAPLVIAAGEAVRAGLPTAARASVMSRAPLSGLFAEGHVGGELGPRLAALADALVIGGSTSRPGAVLVVAEEGRCELVERPELRGLDPAGTVRALERELGPCAVLTIGPAGERGSPFASLASGHAPPSFVGRGGLGAVLGRLGLKAVCIQASARPATVAARSDASSLRSGARSLMETLTRSPRLAARSRGGTLELFPAFGARGELRHVDGTIDRTAGAALEQEALERAAERHGCRGCPTPCGWVFERSDGARQGARFGASHALGIALGFESLDDALFLLGACDRLGVDAKEVGAVLALIARATERGLMPGEPGWGDRELQLQRLESLVYDERAPGRAGAAALARELGLEAEVPISRGQAVRPEANAASLLGQCVASGGADPMRSFPFLLESASGSALERLLAPLPIPPAALDAARPTAKGRLVFWHENLITGVDLTGFCAFSAAGVLADGLAGVDELAGWILPSALADPSAEAWRARAPGARLLAAGANLVLLRRELNRLWGAPAEQDRPLFARERLDQPGMLDEYRALRGLDARGNPRAEAAATLGAPDVLELGLGSLAPAPAEPAAAATGERAPGSVTLQGNGALARALGERRVVELELPATLEELLHRACAGDAALSAQLFAGERVVPAVWRSGRRLLAGELVGSGDVLELVTAIGGG